MMQKKGWWILVIVSVGIMIPFMIPYLTLNPANSRIDITSTTQYSILVTHIGTPLMDLCFQKEEIR